MGEKPLIYDLDFEDLASLMSSWGEPVFRARQIWTGLYRSLWDDPVNFTNLSNAMRERLVGNFSFSHLSPPHGAASSDLGLLESPTMSFAATGAGIILGTAAYMSPEQARGRIVDKRTDIWSFGCVLFECLTGRLMCGGDTVSDTIAKILEREPDWAALPAQTPATVRELLRRCLEKDAKKRQRDNCDVRLDLEAAIATRSTATRMAAATSETRARAALSPRTVAIGAGALVLGAALGIGLWNALGAGTRRASVGPGTIPHYRGRQQRADIGARGVGPLPDRNHRCGYTFDDTLPLLCGMELA